MAHLLLLGLLFSEPINLHLNRAGFTTPNFVTVHQLSTGVLVLGTADHLAVRFDHKGQILNRLSQAEDPNFAYPLSMGMSKNRLFLVCQGSKIWSLNHQLEDLKSHLPALDIAMIQGFYLKRGHFLLYTYGNNPHAFNRVVLDEEHWKVEQSYIPLTYPKRASTEEPAPPTTWVGYHQGLAFQWAPLTVGETVYEVRCFDLTKEGEESMVLNGDLSGLPTTGKLWPYLAAAFYLGEAYLVQLVMADPETGLAAMKYLDVYGAQGVFRKRIKLERHTQLKPLEGSHRLLELNETSLELNEFPLSRLH